MKRSEVKANRIAWGEFLIDPKRKKTKGVLDNGHGGRCCLGHGCKLFESELERGVHLGRVNYDGSTHTAPYKLVELLGLWSDVGETHNGTYNILVDGVYLTDEDGNDIYNLATLNDETDWTPQQIGELVLKLVEGGFKTPFRPLTDYEE